jgi:hypothetical protein
MRRRPKITEFKFDKWAEDLKSWIKDSVSPFEDDSPEKQQKRIERARHDKLFFFKTYLPHYFTKAFAEFHREWADLADLKDEGVLMAVPREFGKSTFFTFGDKLFKICFGLKHFIIILSDTNEQGTTFTLAIALELEENPRLKHDFGKLLGRSWNKSSFITANGTWILARGRKDKIRGLRNRQYRPDEVVVDDFENDQNVLNPKLIKWSIDFLQGTVMGSMGEGYLFLMVGNLFHPKSVLSQLIAMKDEETGEPLYVSRVYDCILDEDTPQERALWPAHWDLPRLKAKRKKMTTRNFNREMRNKCGAEDSPFKEEWFRFHNSIELVLPELIVVTFGDPSAKSGENNDFKAAVSVGLDRIRMIFRVLHAWIRRASIGEFFAALAGQKDTYGSVAVGIEENMFHDFLHEAISNFAKETGRYLPWKPVHHSTHKETRIISTLAYVIEYSKITFEKGHSDQDRLREQLIYILNKTVNDDGPDALEGAVSLLQGGAGGPVEYQSLGKTAFGQIEGAW